MRTVNGDDDSYDEINKEWGKIWRNAGGNIHRDGGDLPAVIWADGYMLYYKNGKPHRNGGYPAVILPNGFAEYWIDGMWQK